MGYFFRLCSLALLTVAGCFVSTSGLGGTDAAGNPPPSGDAGSLADATSARPDATPPVMPPPPPTGCMPATETCDGEDNDCDRRVDEGVTQACMNACGLAGAQTCIDGSFGPCMISDIPPADLCDGEDNDCDPATADGSAEPNLGMACDGDDDDLCPNGIWECSGGSMICTGDEDSGDEECNGLDDDCDGQLDEDDACEDCDRRVRGTRVYLFCHEDSVRKSWHDAVAYCRDRAYTLTTIESEEEANALATTALGLRDADWWLGISDHRTEGTYEWVSGSASTYRNWDEGEPNNWMASSYDCGVIEDGSDGFEERMLWGDRPCGRILSFICELER